MYVPARRYTLEFALGLRVLLIRYIVDLLVLINIHEVILAFLSGRGPLT